MSKWFERFGVAAAIFGFISSIIMAYVYGVTVSVYTTRSFTERNWLLTIITFLVFMFISVLVSSIFFGIAGVLNNQETILSMCRKNNDAMAALLNPKEVTGWKCSKCGKVNADYIGTCGCGQIKS